MEGYFISMTEKLHQPLEGFSNASSKAGVQNQLKNSPINIGKILLMSITK